MVLLDIYYDTSLYPHKNTDITSYKLEKTFSKGTSSCNHQIKLNN